MQKIGKIAENVYWIGANERRGVEQIRVRRMTVLTDCTFYYEGMTA